MVDHGFISVKGNSWCDVCGYRADEHEPQGTFACPICGEETRHTHSSLEIIEHRNKSRAAMLAKSGTGDGVGTELPPLSVKAITNEGQEREQQLRTALHERNYWKSRWEAAMERADAGFLDTVESVFKSTAPPVPKPDLLPLTPEGK